jgi:heptosyltransferase-2
MKKILIIQTAFIGDVILATPVISELNRVLPDSKIDVLVRKGNESLLANNPFINSVLTLDKKNKKWKEIPKIIQQIRNEKYDEIINLHRYASSGIFTVFGNAKATVGFKNNPLSFLYTRKISHSLSNNQHEVERNLACVLHHGTESRIRPSLFPSQEDFKNIEQYKTGNYFCLTPASVWFTKQLPKHKWVELVQLLEKKGEVYLLGGKTDIELCESIIEQSKSKRAVNLAGKLSFLESAALMKQATRNFVNDSGPLHISSAMNAPVTAFFCSTIPAFGFGPLSDDSEIKQVQNLACRPCGIHGHKVCPKNNFLCGEMIDIQ